MVSFDENRIIATFGGDPRFAKSIAAVEDELALSRTELLRAGSRVTEAETAIKAGEEAIRKARDKYEGHAKTVADKEKDLKQHRETEAASAKERDQLGAELQRIIDAAQAAEKALEEARGTAKSTAENDVAAQVAASAAERLGTELERLASTLAESDNSDAAVKTREAASTAAREIITRTKQKGEARSKADAAREELAARAFAAGQKSAEKIRAQADLPPRIKQAEERFAAAQKAIKDLQPQVDKARITLDGSTQDVALAEKSLEHGKEAFAEAKAASDTAQKRISAAEALLNETRSASARAATVPLAGSVAAPSGMMVLNIGINGVASLWDLSSSNVTATSTFNTGTPLALTALRDHEFMLLHSNSVFRINTARPWTLRRRIGHADSSGEPFVDRVNALAFSPDGRLLATGGGEPSRAGELKLWRTRDGTLERDLGAIHSDSVMAAAFSPRGEWLATGGADRFARITPVAVDGLRINLEGHTQHVLDVAWQADGGTIATAGAEGMVKLWNPKTGERRKNVEGFGKEVTGLEPVGTTNQFVAVSGSGQGRLFRNDGEKVHDLAATPAFLQALSVTRNGSQAAGAGDDGVVHIWDLQTGKEILSLPPK